MRILYDHQIFSVQKYGGISRYYSEIIQRMKSEAVLSLIYSENGYLNKNSYCFHRFNFRGKYRLIYFINKTVSVFKMLSNKYDVLHPTYYDSYLLKYNKKPIVVTVHDMINELFPQYFKDNNHTIINKKKLINAASGIIAVSENTKRDLIKIYGIDERKIKVIYHATSFVLSDKVKAQENLPGSYILFVGTRRDYKNFDNFIAGVYRLLYKRNDLHIICVGGGVFSESETSMLNKYKIFDRVHQFSVSDTEIGCFYKQALAFVFPSIYEGFGIPILEAFACGCPVVLSNTSCFPEIAGAAAAYFDPLVPESIFEEVNKVLQSEKLRNQMRKAGYDQLKKYSWEKAAKQTCSVYEDVINTNLHEVNKLVKK